MRGLVIAALAAIVASSGCVQPQPQAPVEVPASEPPPVAVEQPTRAATTTSPAAAPASEMPPASPEQPAPAAATATATTAGPVAAPTDEAPPPAVRQPPSTTTTASPVVADTDNRPAAAPRAPPPPDDAAAVQASPPPSARSSVEATASSPDESILPAAPPVAAAAPAEPPSAPELDLAGLEQRLRETPAIGVFTKLSLKNQVDDLLDQFRGFYQGQLKVPLAELRERYELLLLKVLTLLQDSDRELAEAITASREAIWGILTDPQKLANI